MMNNPDEPYLQNKKEVRRDFCNDEPFAISLYTSIMKKYSEEDKG